MRGRHGVPMESDRVIGVVVVALLVLLAAVIILAMGLVLPQKFVHRHV
jgi:hypothetical protein